MHDIESYKSIFLDHLEKEVELREPVNLFEPIKYILNLGGKRLRPILTLMACDMFGGDSREALNAALCIEVFHNFSLIHDDIMDDAPLRRNKPTVHEKWDINTGILSGDAMLILAYQYLEVYKGNNFQSLISLFSQTAMQVCEGQQYDIDFETRDDVTVPEYLKMIEYKTAVLLGAAMKMGAAVANASDTDQNAIYDFGRYLGIAFQLQDDYLDAFGNPETFGKQVGGDIIENKKTYLYLKALEFSNLEDRKTIMNWYSTNVEDASEKVEAVKELFIASGAESAIQEAVENYTNKAFTVLDNMSLSVEKKDGLKAFGSWLMKRQV